MKNVLLVDNYDSFTYNLAQYFGELGCGLTVVRNDAITVREAQGRDFSHLVISPGPGNPLQSGACNDLIRAFAGKKPVWGSAWDTSASGTSSAARSTGPTG